MTEGRVELLSPAGDFETALAAFAAGADAVYCGLSEFSARAFAKNLSLDELKNLVAYARSQNPPRRVYVTFNTLLDECQLEDAVRTIAALDQIGPDALIVQDLGVARICRRHFPSLELHASTQLVAHNLEGVLALKGLGFRRVVLARELSLEEISQIARRCGSMRQAADGRPEMELECFIHGALCYSISGLCLFGAMEKGRSGNRGTCPYCCRQAVRAGRSSPVASRYPFSMKDLRLGDDARKLAEAGVSSLKIEGRMKSALYVASVTRYYRQILGETSTTALGGNRRLPTAIDGSRQPPITIDDLETVFSRRTTGLYIDGVPTTEPVIDPQSLGHLGTPVGTVKRITKDRDGISWLRFHTSRALERHDGLQFAAPEGGKPYGFGIADMRLALSRSTVFSVPADSDVEVRVPDDPASRQAAAPAILPGATVYCSASNAVKRRFPIPPFRPADYAIGTPIDLTVTLSPTGITASANSSPLAIHCSLSTIPSPLSPAQRPERTADAIRKAFSRLGDTSWTLGTLSVNDPDKLFAPASLLNDLRRQLVAELDSQREAARLARMAAILKDLKDPKDSDGSKDLNPLNVLKLRLGQSLPADISDFEEISFAIGHAHGKEIEASLATRCAELRSILEAAGAPMPAIRLALPVFTHERDFGALRAAVKHMVNLGIDKWEASDLATLRLLRALGLADITADWSLYAFNSAARRQLAALGVRRHVASPESAFLSCATGGCLPSTERLSRQSTPLFISLTRPETPDPSRLVGLKGDEFAAYPIDGLWITARPEPRRYPAPPEAPRRVDLSWDR